MPGRLIFLVSSIRKIDFYVVRIRMQDCNLLAVELLLFRREVERVCNFRSVQAWLKFKK